ncbi:MAG: hypothetical protein QOF80_1272 [Verrucomicrobiota bacterium]
MPIACARDLVQRKDLVSVLSMPARHAIGCGCCRYRDAYALRNERFEAALKARDFLAIHDSGYLRDSYPTLLLSLVPSRPERSVFAREQVIGEGAENAGVFTERFERAVGFRR